MANNSSCGHMEGKVPWWNGGIPAEEFEEEGLDGNNHTLFKTVKHNRPQQRTHKADRHSNWIANNIRSTHWPISCTNCCINGHIGCIIVTWSQAFALPRNQSLWSSQFVRWIDCTVIRKCVWGSWLLHQEEWCTYDCCCCMQSTEASSTKTLTRENHPIREYILSRQSPH